MTSTVEGLNRRVTALERAQSEITETLRWVVTKLARVQAVQDEHTLRLERLESKVESLALKVDSLDAKVERLESKLQSLEPKVDSVESKVDSVESMVDSLPRVMAEMIAASEKRILAAIAERG